MEVAEPDVSEPQPEWAAESWSIAEMSEATGLSAHTLRYYEKVGLVHPVARTGGGQRRYAAADLDWLEFLLRLRETGMSISDMRRFADLRHAGPSTVAARLDQLLVHRRAVQERIAALQHNLAHLDTKIDHYRDRLADR